MAIPKNITKEHLLKAISKIDEEGIPGDSASQYYDVLYNGKKYPPKVVVSFANIFANGVELDRSSFEGGLRTPCFKLLEENGFIIKPKQMRLNKEITLEIVELCKIMFEGRKSGEITTANYSQLFKPYLNTFKEKYTDSPNLIIQNEIKEFYEKQLKTLSSKIEYKNFGFWGRSIYNYTWACIYYNFDREEIPASFSPQLYILINKEGIKFGFCYGHHVNNNDSLVSNALNEKNLDLIFKLLNSDKNLTFFNSTKEEVTARPEKLFGKEEEIIINNKTDLINHWNRNSLLIKEYKLNEIPDNINQIIQDTLINLKDFFISLLPINATSKQSETAFLISPLFEAIKNSQLNISNKTTTRLIGSLITKPFVILTGLSGSGKTKLAQAFANWICENDNQYCLVPVGADWTNREPLLGFPNALKENDYVKPDNRVLDLIIDANKNPDKPFFLILDEMNLSHVERYFADFLSVMESKGEIALHSGNSDWNSVPAKIGFPKNLFIIGTVNIDETTYMFSPKVLDRSNVIEFRVTKEEMETYLQNSTVVNLETIKAQGSNMATGFVEFAKSNHEYENTEILNKTLITFFEELKKSGAEFGYRSASEILRFAAVIKKLDTEWNENEIIDAAIMQKLLPKVHGSRRKLEPALKTLGALCLNEPNDIETLIVKSELKAEDYNKIKYRISFEKINRMYQNLISNGFTSYAEA